MKCLQSFENFMSTQKDVASLRKNSVLLIRFLSSSEDDQEELPQCHTNSAVLLEDTISSILSRIASIWPAYPLEKLLFTVDESPIQNPFILSRESHDASQTVVTAEIVLDYLSVKDPLEVTTVSAKNEEILNDIIKTVQKIRFLDGSFLYIQKPELLVKTQMEVNML